MQIKRYLLATVFFLSSMFCFIPLMAQENAELVDISPTFVRLHGSDPENVRKGREVIGKAVEMLGFEQWKAYSTLEVVAEDIWTKKNRWWPSKEQRFRAHYALETFTSKMELIDGPWKGSILGVQSWQGYKRKDSNAPLSKSSDPLLLFYLPSIHYFNELPFRLLAAQYITYAGEGKHRGKTYDLVYATWGSLKANPDFDQFVLWIDQETHLVRMCHYTVRQAFPAAAGTIYFDSYKNVQGVMVPFKHFVLLEWPEQIKFPLEENFFHRVEIDHAEFDAIGEDKLLPISGLPKPADTKPNIPIDWEAK